MTTEQTIYRDLLVKEIGIIQNLLISIGDLRWQLANHSGKAIMIPDSPQGPISLGFPLIDSISITRTGDKVISWNLPGLSSYVGDQDWDAIFLMVIKPLEAKKDLYKTMVSKLI